MAAITSVIPCPVPVRFGGQAFLAAEFRLADLAELQAWLSASVPSPYEEASFRLHYGPRDKEWYGLLSKVIDDQEHYPPQAGDYLADDLLESPDGIRKQIHLSIRRYNTAFSEELARNLYEVAIQYPTVFRVDYARFQRVCWGIDPSSILTSLVDGPVESSNTPPNWADLYYRYLTEVTGPAPQFEELTIGQFRAWRMQGKTGSGNEENRADWMQIARKRAEFWSEMETDG